MNHITSDATEERIPQAEFLIAQIRDCAKNLFETRQLLCTEAVMVALNRGLDGGLAEDQTIAMTAPFCEAVGGSGCLCGALSGAVMASGLFLGKDHPYRYRREMRDAARQLHDAFKTSNGSTCCKALTQKVKHDKQQHFRQCAGLTAEAAELAARLILEKRPGIISKADKKLLTKRHSRFQGALIRLARYFPL